MPVSVGPEVYGADDLVFAYDLGDVKNSYIGEPVENLQSVNEGNVYTNVGTTNTTAELVNMSTPFGNKAWKITIPASGANGYSSTRAQGPTIQINRDGTPYFHGAYVWMSDSDYALWNQTSSYIYKYSTGSNGMGQWSHYPAFDKKDKANRTWKLWGAVNSNSSGGTGNQYHTFFKNGNLTNDLVFYIVAPMWGVNKLHPVQFTAGTRSATQGLLDLTGNSTIDLTNVSFDSNAQMTFDGTSDYIEIPNTNLPAPSTTLTMECIFQRDSGRTIINYGPAFNGASKYYNFEITSPTQLRSNLTTTAGSTGLLGTTTISANTWYHGVLTYDGVTVKLYVNGNLEASASTSGEILNSSTPSLNIGRKNLGNGEYINGEVALAKTYSRALSASEIKSNFNAIKGRFNI
jgi:hypothetical protein